MEHRWGERVCIDHSVRVSASRWRAVAQISNLSVSGAYLVGAPPPPRITCIKVEFGTPQQRVLIEADVVRRTHDGFALEWREFAPRAVRRLLERAADPDAALRRSA